MTSVRWDDGMYTLKGNQQQKPLKINGWLVGWFRWHFLCKFTYYFSGAWNVSCLGCSFFSKRFFRMKTQFRMIHVNITGYGFSTCKKLQGLRRWVFHPNGWIILWTSHGDLPHSCILTASTQKTHLRAGSPEISQFPEFSDYWCHHLTRSDTNPAYKVIIKKHVQMECHLNGTFDPKRTDHTLRVPPLPHLQWFLSPSPA